MTLKIAHIATAEKLQERQQVKELAERLMEKWVNRDRVEAKKMFPGYGEDEKKRS